MLQDQFGRRFQYLRLSITDVCNFKCQYCLPDGYSSDSPRNFLTLAEIDTLLNAFAQLGMKKIRLTGGEPTLRKDLPEIIALARSVKGIEHVGMTTNGFKLTSHLKSYVDAGLNSVNISVDSLQPERFIALTGYNKVENVMAGIEHALQSGLASVKLNAVLLKQFNFAELDQTLVWLKDKKLTYRFIELMETGSNDTFFQRHFVSGQAVKETLLQQGWQKVIRPQWAGPAEEFFHADYAGRIGLIMPYAKDFCASCNRLRVSATGKLHLCLFAEQGLELRHALSAGDVGATREFIVETVHTKKQSHSLHKHQTGATRHLAMLGG